MGGQEWVCPVVYRKIGYTREKNRSFHPRKLLLGIKPASLIDIIGSYLVELAHISCKKLYEARRSGDKDLWLCLDRNWLKF